MRCGCETDERSTEKVVKGGMNEEIETAEMGFSLSDFCDPLLLPSALKNECEAATKDGGQASRHHAMHPPADVRPDMWKVWGGGQSH